jgi:hypothetical protein
VPFTVKKITPAHPSLRRYSFQFLFSMFSGSLFPFGSIDVVGGFVCLTFVPALMEHMVLKRLQFFNIHSILSDATIRISCFLFFDLFVHGVLGL